MKRLLTLIAAGSLCAALMAPAPAHALNDEQRAALAAMLVIGLGVAAARHGSNHDSSSDWDEGRFGEPFAPANGVVCLPRPRQCYVNGAVSWQWTQRIFG